MKTILSILLIAGTFPFMSTADDAQNVVHLPKGALSSKEKDFTNLILLPTNGIRNVGMIGKAQQKYIKKLYPDHRVVLSVYIKDQKGRYIEAVSCVNSENDMVQVYFDMSNVYKYLKSKNENSKLEIEKLEKSYVIVK